MVTKKAVSASVAVVIGVILFLALPVRSQKVIELGDCPTLVTNGPCAPETIPSSSNPPLILTLTDSDELLAADSSDDITRNVVISLLFAAGYYVVTSKQNTAKKKSKKKGPAQKLII